MLNQLITFLTTDSLELVLLGLLSVCILTSVVTVALIKRVIDTTYREVFWPQDAAK